MISSWWSEWWPHFGCSQQDIPWKQQDHCSSIIERERERTKCVGISCIFLNRRSSWATNLLWYWATKSVIFFTIKSIYGSKFIRVDLSCADSSMGRPQRWRSSLIEKKMASDGKKKSKNYSSNFTEKGIKIYSIYHRKQVDCAENFL